MIKWQIRGAERPLPERFWAGCGWYVEIVHTDGVLTRYCHLLSRPGVGVGQRVQAGQQIGYVGSSGNADGAHLHFEVHVRDAAGGDEPVDAVAFLARRGVRLGEA